MDTTYSEEQYELAYPPGIEHHWWTTARNELIAELLRMESEHGRSILEVGCGKGVVVKGLREKGFDIRGVELAEVKPLDGASDWVTTGMDARDLDVDVRARVSGLLLLDVIEHLPAPGEFLEVLVDSFTNLSFVIVTVPACQELWSNYDDFAGHQRRYTLETLGQLGSVLGWQAVRSGYFFRLPYLPMRMMSLLGVNRNLKIVPPGRLTRPIHRLVSAASRLEQSIVPSTVRGSSAFALFHL